MPWPCDLQGSYLDYESSVVEDGVPSSEAQSVGEEEREGGCSWFLRMMCQLSLPFFLPVDGQCRARV